MASDLDAANTANTAALTLNTTLKSQHADALWRIEADAKNRSADLRQAKANAKKTLEASQVRKLTTLSPRSRHPEHLQPSALSPQPSTLCPLTSTLSPQPSALSPQPSALSPEPSALSPQP